MYGLGIDLGTTATAAAVAIDGNAEIVALGAHSATMPSVVYVDVDNRLLMGDAAELRARTEPDRVAREFKRQFGDIVPLLLGGAPFPVEVLTGKFLHHVYEHVVSERGDEPAATVLTLPATWRDYRKELIEQCVRIAQLDQVTLLTEPEAAAVDYASRRPLEHGALIAVYDLGGGTFDITLLAATGSGFELVGQPDGIEHLGGIDFDAGVLAHVSRSLDGPVDALDPRNDDDAAALAQLREDCVRAKEALSSATEVEIPVFLRDVRRRVRLTRGEFERMIKPSLLATIDTVRRCLATARVDLEAVTAVLLVGGSSRIPLVSQLVADELRRPIAVDAHPKHAVALGAARWAMRDANPRPVSPPADVTTGSRPVDPQPVRPAPTPARPTVRATMRTLLCPDGQIHLLDRDYIIGRAPETHPDVTAGTASSLTVPEDDLTASRTHCALRVRAGEIIVEDLGSANGTFLVAEGDDQWSWVGRNGRIVPAHARILVGEWVLRVEPPRSH